MKRSVYILTSLLLSVVLVGAGCNLDPSNEDPCQEKITIYLGGEFATMNYGIGSYWLMADSTSQVVDTVRITQFDHGFVTNVQCGTPVMEFYQYQVELPYLESPATFLLTPKGLIMDPDPAGKGSIVYFGTEGLHFGHGNVETFPEMQIGQELYQDVSLCVLENDPLRGGLRTDFHMNAGQGFLRMTGYEEDGAVAFDKVLLRAWIYR